MDSEQLAAIRTKPTKLDVAEMVLSVFVMAFGVVLTVKSCQGVGPISSLPYVLSEVFGLTLGTLTFIVYVCFILIQWAIYRDRGMYLRTLSQLPFTLIYSLFVDLIQMGLSSWTVEGLAMQWLVILAALFLTALAIVMEVDANVSMLADDGLILAVHRATRVPFDRCVILVNISFVVSAFLISWFVLGGLYGVGLGTIFVGVAQGFVVKGLTPLFKRYRKGGHLD